MRIPAFLNQVIGGYCLSIHLFEQPSSFEFPYQLEFSEESTSAAFQREPASLCLKKQGGFAVERPSTLIQLPLIDR